MKIFVAGATGALGRQLVPMLVERGHEVTGMTRSPVEAAALASSARGRWWRTRSTPRRSPRAVAEAEPEVIVHQLTALSGRARHAALRPRLRPDQPSADRGHRPPARRRPRASGVAAVRGPELRRLAVRPRRRPVKTEDGPARPQPAGAMRHDARGDPASRGGGHRRRLDRGRRAPLRRLLRPRHLARLDPEGEHDRGDPRAQVPARRATAAGCGRSSTSTTPPTATVAAVERGEPRHLQRRRRRAGAGREWLPAAGRQPSAPSRRGACRAGSAGSLAGEAATVMMTEVRGALEREGQARARLAAALRRAGARLRDGAGLIVTTHDAPRGAAAGGVRDRLPHARQRERGRGRRAGGAPAPAPRARGGRADRVAARLPVDGGHAPGDRRAALGPRAARDLRRRVAARAAAHRRARDDPAGHAEMADSLSLAFLVLLESLSPEQRAAFLLRDVFDYPLRRDRRDRRQERGRTRASSPTARAATWTRAGRASRRRREQRDELAGRFFAAAEEGDLAGLESLLAEDVVLHGDGGGKAPALARAAARRAARRARRSPPGAAAPADRRAPRCERVEVNGQPGAVSRRRRASVRRLGARHRRRPRPGDPLGRQPRQARAPGRGRRRAGPAARALGGAAGGCERQRRAERDAQQRPASGALAASTEPPWASAAWRTMARPEPAARACRGRGRPGRSARTRAAGRPRRTPARGRGP